MVDALAIASRKKDYWIRDRRVSLLHLDLVTAVSCAFIGRGIPLLPRWISIVNRIKSACPAYLLRHYANSATIVNVYVTFRSRV
jgi:hypothetical protein